MGYTKTIELQKKRGVYWLPVQSDEGKGPEPTVLAATKAAKKVVPAEAMSLEEGAGGTAQGQAADGTALARASSSRGPEAQEAADRPALGKPPEEDSEAQRKTRSKRIPDLVSEQEYKDHMMTHLPFGRGVTIALLENPGRIPTHFGKHASAKGRCHASASTTVFWVGR